MTYNSPFPVVHGEVREFYFSFPVATMLRQYAGFCNIEDTKLIDFDGCSQILPWLAYLVCRDGSHLRIRSDLSDFVLRDKLNLISSDLNFTFKEVLLGAQVA